MQGGLLEVDPGVGTLVARSAGEQRRRLLDREVSRLVAEARVLGLSLEDVVDALRGRWSRARGPRE